MEAELNSKSVKIPYCSHQNLLLMSEKPIVIKAAQCSYLNVGKILSKYNIITDLKNSEHMIYSVQNNTLMYTNASNKVITLYPGSIIANIEMDLAVQNTTLQEASLIDPEVPLAQANMFKQLIQTYSNVLSK